MARKPTGNPNGRPRKQIDQKLFEELCQIHCTEQEIIHIFKVSEDTLVAWCKRTYGETFLEAYKRLSAGGKMSLRRQQFKIAETNATMAIWLGKQYLGQKDVSEDANGAQVVADAIIKAAEKRESK